MKETRITEFKSDVSNTFLKTVSAYANFISGTIKFGIKDDGTICGIDNPQQACLDIENKINDNISPKPDYILDINYRTNVITLSVSEGRYKPYLYRGKAYRRSDTATVEVDSIELKRLILEGSNMNFEELESKKQDLEFTYLEETLIKTLKISSLTEDMLRTFGFYVKNNRFNIVAEIFADKNTFYGIDMVRFGKNISEIMDRETITGVSVLKQYDEAVDMFRRYYQYEKIEGVKRIQTDLIPEAAFREALANSLIHRSWDENVHVKIAMYLDRVEIISPGGLSPRLSKDEYLNGNISCLRNPIMGGMFFRMHYIEMFGTGILRIKDEYLASMSKPKFEVYDNSLKVILPVLNEQYNVTSDGRKVIDLLQNGILLSSMEIANQLGWSKDKVIREINLLKSSGYLSVTGNGRGTKYRLV